LADTTVKIDLEHRNVAISDERIPVSMAIRTIQPKIGLE
jgi:hypothetical protein